MRDIWTSKGAVNPELTGLSGFGWKLSSRTKKNQLFQACGSKSVLLWCEIEQAVDVPSNSVDYNSLKVWTVLWSTFGG